MWISDKHPNPPRPAEPPVDTGRRLLTLPRGQGNELRVSLSEYEGKPYVSLRVWTRGEGGYYPSKSGTSIRIREVGDIIEALMQVEDLAREQGRASGGRPSGHAQGIAPRPATPPPGRPTPDRTGNPYDRMASPPGASSDDGDRPVYQPPRRPRPQPRTFDPSAMPPPREGSHFDEF